LCIEYQKLKWFGVMNAKCITPGAFAGKGLLADGNGALQGIWGPIFV